MAKEIKKEKFKYKAVPKLKISLFLHRKMSKDASKSGIKSASTAPMNSTISLTSYVSANSTCQRQTTEQ
jgi:hypothetical protein